VADIEDDEDAAASQRGRISPSEFMRARRPEYYSDTGDRTSYALDRPTFEYHLDSLTSRNETHDFEIFCRKLCERTICPHLRPHSGPEGGGDGKTDSESIPIADEVSELFYAGDADAGKRKLAFAFSAKEKWTDKVRRDVKGIAETERGYDRIYFVTNQFARAKTVAELERQLEADYGIPVTILDRSWIVEQVIDHDRKDIAYNYLGVGQMCSDPLRLGPTDYSRTQQLAEVEQELADPTAFVGMESQRVTEALVAAKLSRNLERPRIETDGRFDRAIRLANKYGSYRQKLEAQYEHLWTAVWWFDDLQLLNDRYDEFAAQAIGASHIRNLEFLTNLLQLLFNAVIHRHLTRSECKLDARALDVRNALQVMADEADRPNNSLEAQASLILMRLNFAIVDRQPEMLPQIWTDLGNIFDRAEGLGEFPAQRLANLIEEMGNIAGNDPRYNELIEKVAEFVAKRESEASGGLILLYRADMLESDDHFDIIRFAGRAAIRLTQKEHTSSLVRALQLLTLAYRRAGLLWVARASCAFVAASILIESEEDTHPSISFIPTMKIWAWLSVELGHLPDALLAIQLLNGALATLPLTNQSKAKVEKDLQELDYALGALFLNATDADLEKMRALPDLLDGLGLLAARAALLYIMGRESLLREEGSIPAEESPEDARRLMSMLANAPVVQESAPNFIFNDGPQSISTRLLGMRLDISTDSAESSLLVGELVATSLEAFFATAPDQDIIPHASNFAISIEASDNLSEPAFEVDEFGVSGKLTWPASLAPYAFQNQTLVRELMLDVAAKVQAHAFMTPRLEEYLERLYVQDAVQSRMAMALASGNSYHRVNHRFFTTLADWSEHGPKTYPIGPRPVLDTNNLSTVEAEDKAAGTAKSERGRIRIDDHRDIEVRSVIDVHAWDKAGWKGTGYLQFSPDQPPVIALLFECEQAARHIFSRWRERFGEVDKDHDIHVAIIRDYDKDHPSHYIMQIASKPAASNECAEGRSVILASRCIENTPPDNANLDRFINQLAEHGCCGLMPAIVKPGIVGEPDLLADLVILRRDVSVKRADQVGEYDIEALALEQVRRRSGQENAKEGEAATG
jgi:hypothetical protein